MARITVDDCLKRIPNRFDMTLVATIRARQLSIGGSPMVEPARDKPTVIALRELAQGKVGVEILTMGTLWFYSKCPYLILLKNSINSSIELILSTKIPANLDL